MNNQKIILFAIVVFIFLKMSQMANVFAVEQKTNVQKNNLLTKFCPSKVNQERDRNGCHVYNLRLYHTDLTNAVLSGGVFINADLYDVNLSGANLQNANLRGNEFAQF